MTAPASQPKNPIAQAVPAADHHYDLVISGGGMTGAMLAYLLSSQLAANTSKSPLQIAIVEQQALTAVPAPQSMAKSTSQQAPAASFDSRSIALSAASVELLQQWQLWPELAEHSAAIEHILVSDQGHFGKHRLSAASQQRQSLGQVLEVEALGALLFKKLAAFEQITWFRPDQIIAIHPQQDRQLIELASGQQISAQLLILAEGGDSPSRQLAGINCQRSDYQQSALIANIGLAQPHQQRAFERFTKDGPLALLPLVRQRYSLVWTCSPAQAEALQQCSDNEFLDALQQQFGGRAGRFVAVGQRQIYPLKLKLAETISQHRLLLCGNSLHNLHPIAGQGFNLALRDLHAIWQLLQLQLQSTEPDLGAYALTRAYQQLRQDDMAKVVWLTDGLVRLFANDSKMLALLRNLGLAQLDNCPVLTQTFAAQSMGLTALRAQQQQLQRFAQATKASVAAAAAGIAKSAADSAQPGNSAHLLAGSADSRSY